MKETKKLFIDTNIFVRALTNDNKKLSVEAIDFLDFANKTTNVKSYTSVVVLMEIGWVLSSFYGYNKSEIILALSSIEKMTGIKISNIEINFKKGIRYFKKHHIKLGDAMIVAGDIIQKEKAIIVSYDKDFDKIKEVVRMTPREVLKKFKR